VGLWLTLGDKQQQEERRQQKKMTRLSLLTLIFLLVYLLQSCSFPNYPLENGKSNYDSPTSRLRGPPGSIAEYLKEKKKREEEQKKAMIASEILAHIIPIMRIPYHPYSFDFHMTRYFGGCFGQELNKDFNPIPPFLRNFQIMVTSCGIGWATGSNGGQSTCVYRWNDMDMMQIEHYRRLRQPPHPPKLRRIHVHSDRRHQLYFLNHVWPILAQRAETHGEKYIIHSGGGDVPQFLHELALFTNASFVEKWIVEQAIFDEFLEHPKIVLSPIGICARESVGFGSDLRELMTESTSENHTVDEHPQHLVHIPHPDTTHHEVTDISSSFSFAGAHHHHPHHSHHLNLTDLLAHPNSSHPMHVKFSPTPSSPFSLTSANDYKTDSPTGISSSPSVVSATDSAASPGNYIKRLLQTAAEHNNPSSWHKRKNKILFCFYYESYEKRRQVVHYVLNHTELADYCDVCDGTLTHRELWMKYTDYKFVFAPWGNGPDCFRNWEIMVLGAIPVIQYFTGAHGYLRAGLSAVLLKNNEELTVENITRWSQEFTGPNPMERLSGEWWMKYLFYS
jgi:hypothetical protein